MYVILNGEPLEEVDCFKYLGSQPNQKCMYGAALAISGNHFLYLVVFGMPLEPYYFELVIVGLR